MGNAITHLCPRAAQIYAALRSDTCVRTTPTRVPLIIIRAYSDVCQRYAGTVSPDDGNDAADLRWNRRFAARFQGIASCNYTPFANISEIAKNACYIFITFLIFVLASNCFSKMINCRRDFYQFTTSSTRAAHGVSNICRK